MEKLLIANRGEIACRIARTANRLGIPVVAVYSTADRQAQHVELCDQAVALSGSSAEESYLDHDQIIAAARRCGADAIHPGYGFLSENADFARQCQEQGITFVGPPARAIEIMGIKSLARETMAAAGVPVLTGYDSDNQDGELLRDQAGKIGYPLLIKAVAGGGGKGMRRVESDDEFMDALGGVQRESLGAFGDSRVLLEKFLPTARHVEVQVFADNQGNCVHMYERDCSLQRRHQKVIEESPAPGMAEDLRDAMTSAAVSCARAINYVGAGTVEFLLGPDGEFHFMEMNTRLQVEHPVTEMVTGLDLVAWQLTVAEGQPLPCSQQQITLNGHAVEARIYAENTEQGFLPASGTVAHIRHPDHLDGVRVDSGIRSGDVITTHYDPMISKVIAHAPTRRRALARLCRALDGYELLGLSNNIAFAARLLRQDDIVAGQPSTRFIDSRQDSLIAEDRTTLHHALAAACCYVILDGRPHRDTHPDPWAARDGWRNGLAHKAVLELSWKNTIFAVHYQLIRNRIIMEIDGREMQVTADMIDPVHIKIEEGGERRILPVRQFQTDQGVSIELQLAGQNYILAIVDRRFQDLEQAAVEGSLNAPMPGSVVAVAVKTGQKVRIGQALMTLEAMKMEHQIKSPVEGQVKSVNFTLGDQVSEGDVLLEIVQ